MEWVWFSFAAVVLFVFLGIELYALDAGKTTLSKAIGNVVVHFPLTVWASGVFTGSLALHLFGHVCVG
jgi:hypothetical protein